MKKFFSDFKAPQTLALIVLGIAFVIMLLAFVLQKTTSDIVDSKFYWMTATAMLLFFGVASSLSSISSKEMETYFRNSVFSFAVLAVITGLLAYLFSGISISNAGSYSWLFKVVFFVFVIFMTLVKSIKSVIEFAQKEEWNAPKPRNRKK